jgi:L-seryl-tRNA(Ser) seleniumtransferase
MKAEEYRRLPAVDKVLQSDECRLLVNIYGLERVTDMLRIFINQSRAEIAEGKKAITASELLQDIENALRKKCQSSLKAVINGTGIVLHTNLGRAPLGKKILKDMQETLAGYTNLEFDLATASRGHRNDHIRELISEITGAEDALVVNNNAAAVMLILRTFAEAREVIISRGELIEIGGSFRIPDIMSASGAIMIETGCTNRTKSTDYLNAITPNTSIIFKAHKSNYFIGGFCEEVGVNELADISHQSGLMMVYDIGSGLLRKPKALENTNEPDVKSALIAGADLVCFSGDKLLGGAQAGIIAGRSEYIQQLASAPLMRALRVGKLTISALISVMSAYLNDENLFSSLPVFRYLNRNLTDLQKLAEDLRDMLADKGVQSKIVESVGRCGGGTMPELQIPSLAVQLLFSQPDLAEKLHHSLLQANIPVLGVLREGELLFDVLCFAAEELPLVAEQAANCILEL